MLQETSTVQCHSESLLISGALDLSAIYVINTSFMLIQAQNYVIPWGQVGFTYRQNENLYKSPQAYLLFNQTFLGNEWSPY